MIGRVKLRNQALLRGRDRETCTSKRPIACKRTVVGEEDEVLGRRKGRCFQKSRARPLDGLVSVRRLCTSWFFSFSYALWSSTLRTGSANARFSPPTATLRHRWPLHSLGTTAPSFSAAAHTLVLVATHILHGSPPARLVQVNTLSSRPCRRHW